MVYRIVAASLAFLWASPAFAQPESSRTLNLLQTLGGEAGFFNPSSAGAGVYDQNRIAFIVGGFIQIALSLAGIVFVLLMVYGGYLWMTARGNEDQVTRSITLIRNSIIGIIIAFGAFIITEFALGTVSDVL